MAYEAEVIIDINGTSRVFYADVVVRYVDPRSDESAHALDVSRIEESLSDDRPPLFGPPSPELSAADRERVETAARGAYEAAMEAASERAWERQWD